MPDTRSAQGLAQSDAAERPASPAGAILALGIVYGDLGTSPLYTLPAVMETLGGRITPEAGLGILSLIVWSLVIIVSVKYCIFVMRADNNGEGGILALMSLVAGRGFERAPALVVMGLFGAALLYGDGIITPAISVLSALEGVEVASDALKPYVVPVSVAILVILFAVQNRGTARLGSVMGPVMLVWFATIAVLGVAGIWHHPGVLLYRPAPRGNVSRAWRLARLRAARRRVSRADRGRGALRRYRAFRPQPDPCLVVRDRAARAAVELCRADGASD